MKWGISEHDHRIVHEAMDRLGVDGMRGRFLSQLSVGERQKVMLARALAQQPKVKLTVFCPDSRKSGGAYETITGNVKKIDPVTRILVLTEGEVIPVDRIYGIECLANY